MPKPALELQRDGTYNISDGKIIVGGLIPVRGTDLFTVRMGQFGGFYSKKMPFDEALAFLMERLVISYTNRMDSVRRGANLIYKKSLKANKKP